MAKPEFTDPNASVDVKKFIAVARTMMYSMVDQLKHAITGANTLADGAVPLLVQLVTMVEDKLGELSAEDAEKVLVHLAGSLVDFAEGLGDPEAKNKRAVVTDIVGKCMETFANAEAQGEPQDQGMPPDSSEAMPEAGMSPLMGGAGG